MLLQQLRYLLKLLSLFFLDSQLLLQFLILHLQSNYLRFFALALLVAVSSSDTLTIVHFQAALVHVFWLVLTVRFLVLEGRLIEDRKTMVKTRIFIMTGCEVGQIKVFDAF